MLAAALVLRCSPSSVSPLTPQAVLWGCSHRSLHRSRNSHQGSDMLVIHASYSLENFLLQVCAFLGVLLMRREIDTSMLGVLLIVCFVPISFNVLALHVTSASVLGHHLVF